jgi:diguanylate cyclase (GGDEF)-like protein/PAS domain S-box-containing protein
LKSKIHNPIKSVALPRKSASSTQKQLVAENQDLHTRLDESEETLRAIRGSEVDALIVPGVGGEQIFTLEGAEHTYRVLVEQMGEGAATLSVEGVILFSNHRFSEMLAVPIEKIVGENIRAFVSPSDHAALDAGLNSKMSAHLNIECILTAGEGTSTPARLTLVFLPLETPPVFGLTAADLAEGKRREHELEGAREKLEDRIADRTAELQREIGERKQMQEKLKEMSIHDALTGLYNRRFFNEEMMRFERGRQFPVSIVMADLDNLKKTNDSYGHAAGDAMLQRAAQVLNATFRADDIIARIGGDEFAVLLPNTDAESAQQALHRGRRILDEHNTAHGGKPLRIALGVSTTEQGGILTDALKEADEGMYRDKHDGSWKTADTWNSDEMRGRSKSNIQKRVGAPSKPVATKKQLLLENEDLLTRLNKAEEILRAIRSDEVDALVVPGVDGDRVFTLKGADHTYRILIEQMSEGALTMTKEGVILYANRHLAKMLRMPLEKVIGSTLHTWVAPDSQEILRSLLKKGEIEKCRDQLVLAAHGGILVPVYLSVSSLHIKGCPIPSAWWQPTSPSRNAATV